jgi:hypothetical protein
MAEEFDIPDHLKRLFSDQPEMRREQKRLRRKYGYDSQTIRQRGQAELNHAHYEREILLASEGLASLQGSDNEDAIRHETRRLAENLMKTGKFAEALEVATDEVQIVEIQAMQQAIDIDDRDKCGCKDDFVNGVHIPRHVEKGTIFSDKHRGLTPIVQCSKCGHLNVTPHVPKRPKLDALFPKGRPILRNVVRSR